ncbi:MAG: protein kinase [Victivallales bacterium]|nr:protein kinase [Victivallales bacterium]
MPELTSTFHELQPGTIVNGYRIERELGRGAMAIVYLATQLDLERPVAFKLLSAELSSDKEFVSRFFNEARAAAALSHPHIIQAYDAGALEGGLYYFCMEYVDGEMLMDRIQKEGRLLTEEALPIMIPIAKALQYGFQTHKFTHGDIKPENIMLTQRGEPKLADFGLARIEGHDFSGSDVMLTPLYAAPELIQGLTNTNCLSDIYAFGATLFHALIGDPPFPGTNPQQVMERQLTEQPQRLIDLLPEISPELSQLVDDMLAKDPALRPQSWTEVIERLKACLKSSSEQEAPPPLTLHGNVQAQPSQQQKDSHSGLIAFLVILVALVGLGVGAFLFMHSRKSPAPQPEPTPEEVQPVAQPAEQALPPAPVEERKTEQPQKPTPPKPAPVKKPAPKPAPKKPVPKPAPKKPVPKPAVKKPAVQEKVDVPAKILEEFAASLRLPYELPPYLRMRLRTYDALSRIFTARGTFPAPATEQMMAECERLLASYKEDDDIFPFLQFLHNTALPALDEFRPKVIQSVDKLQGTELPSLRQKNERFIIRSIELDQAVVARKSEIGTVQNTFTWTELWKQGIALAICNELLQKSQPINLQDNASFLAVLALSERRKNLPALLAPLKAEPDYRHWLTLANLQDIVNYDNNRRFAMTVRELQNAFQQGNPYMACRIAEQFLELPPKSLPAADRQALQSIVEALRPQLPEQVAGAMVRQAQDLLKEENPVKANPALNLLVLTQNRYGYDKFKFPEKKEIPDLMNHAIGLLEEPKDVPITPMNMFLFPFLNAQSPQRTFMLFRAMVQPASLNTTTERRQKSIITCRPMALFERGDWSEALKLIAPDFKSNIYNYKPGDTESKMYASLAYLLTISIAQDRFGDEDITPYLDIMKQYAGKNTNLQLPIVLTALLTHYHTAEARSSRLPLGNLFTTPQAPLHSPVARALLYLSLAQLFEAGPEDSAAEAELARIQEALKAPKFDTKYAMKPEHVQAVLSTLYKWASEEKRRVAIPADVVELDKPLEWAWFRALLAAARPDQGLKEEPALRAILKRDVVRWPMAGGDAVYQWLLLRVAWELNHRAPKIALQDVEWVLSLQAPCLSLHYADLQFLRATLYALAGMNGGFSTCAQNLRVSLLASKYERQYSLALAEPGAKNRKTPEQIIAETPAGKSLHFWNARILCASEIQKRNKLDAFAAATAKYAPSPAEIAFANALVSFNNTH